MLKLGDFEITRYFSQADDKMTFLIIVAVFSSKTKMFKRKIQNILLNFLYCGQMCVLD